MGLPTSRMKKIERTGIRQIFDQALSYEQQGRKVIHFEIGRPVFDTPEDIKKAAILSLKEGRVHYTSNYGIHRLKEAIANKLAQDNRVFVDPKKEIIVTAGAVEGLTISTLALLEPGDEVLILNPAFTSYFNQVRYPGAVPISVPLRWEKRFQPQLKDLQEKVTDKTRMLILNTPHNPTGTVFHSETIGMLAQFAKDHDLLVLSDECYDDIVFAGEHLSIASIPGMKERTVTIHSTSKTFSMTGWRVGFVASSQEIIDYLIRIHQDVVICTCSFAQEGAAYAYENRNLFIPPLLEALQKRREMVISTLQEIAGIEFMIPEGGFYVFPSIGNFHLSDWDFCHYVLNSVGVALVPGESFGEFGRGHFRLSYPCSLSHLKSGLAALKKAVERLDPVWEERS